MGVLMEAQLGRLGARWSLNFRPRARGVWASPVGRFHDRPFALRVALVRAGEAVGLPFDPTVTPAPDLRQTFAPASLRFMAAQVCFGLDLTVEVVAPFYPQNMAIAETPVFLVDVRVARTGAAVVPLPRDMTLEVAFLPLAGAVHTCEDGAVIIRTMFGHAPDRNAGLDPAEERPIPGTVGLWPLGQDRPDSDGVFRVPVTTAEEPLAVSFALVGHCAEPVLTVNDAPHRFAYLDHYPTPASVAEYAQAHEATLRARTAFFERCVTASSLDPAAVSLLSQGWQGYLTNTWRTRATEGHKEWFSVWEGNCLYHNTVDVEFHNAIALLLLWPDLLRRQLVQWAAAVDADGIVPHDLGVGLTAGRRQAYPHPMPVEECCNFLILLFTYWRFTDDWGVVETHLDVVRRVTAALMAFDADGDGFHETGTANTIDDGGPAVQFAPKQTYLAIKALAALDGVATIADEAADDAWAHACRDRAAAARHTLDADAWVGDGYRVSLLREDDSAENPWMGTPHDGPLFDAGARSPWTTLGLLYAALVDSLPDVDPVRIRTELLSALTACAGPWGSRHSSAEPVRGWVSQNIARDIVAAYFGVDLAGQAGRYWAFEQAQNTSGAGGAFVDTLAGNFLAYYPRGAVAMGWLAAAAGLRLDRAAERLTLSPPRVPVRVPLLALADWARGRVPWATFRLGAGRVVAEFTHEDLVQAVGDVNIEFGPALEPGGPDVPVSDI